MNFRSIFLGLIALAIGLVAVFAAILLNHPMPILSTTAPRFTDSYDRVINPSGEPLGLDLESISSVPVTVTNSVDALRVEFVLPDPLPDVDLPGFDVIRLPAPGSDGLAGAGENDLDEILPRLKGIGIGYAPFEASDLGQYSVQTRLEVFDSNLNRVTGQEADSVFGRHHQTVDFRGQFPALTMLVETDDTVPMKFLNIRMFDARTGVDLLTGHGVGGGRFHVSPRIWHQGPVDVVFDAAFGPVQRERLDPVPGSSFLFRQGAIRLIAVHEGSSSGSSSGSRGETNVVEVIWNTDEPDEPRTETQFVFLCLPKAMNLPLSIQFLDRDGKDLPGGLSNSSGLIYRAEVPAQRDEIAAIEVSYYPNLKRFVLPLPEIPGLPEENREVDDLLRVRVPWIRFRNEHDFQRTLESLLQVRFQSQFNPTIPAADFPLVFENRTAGELLDAYLAYFPAMSAVRLDPDTFELKIEKSPLRKALDWIQNLF